MSSLSPARLALVAGVSCGVAFAVTHLYLRTSYTDWYASLDVREMPMAFCSPGPMAIPTLAARQKDGTAGHNLFGKVVTNKAGGAAMHGTCQGRLLDGCRYVYLDVGSNVGVQIRKLFEPELYPLAEVRPVFEEHFGTPTERASMLPDLCAVGWEPNPRHTKRLKEVEQCYMSRGFNTHFFTETLVDTFDGMAPLFLNDDGDNGEKRNFWSASTFSSSKGSKAYNVTSMDLARFIREEVDNRCYPRGSSQLPPPFVIMKMDIEGSEYHVLPHMIVQGGICPVNLVFAEFHDKDGKGVGKGAFTAAAAKTMLDSAYRTHSCSTKAHHHLQTATCKHWSFLRSFASLVRAQHMLPIRATRATYRALHSSSGKCTFMRARNVHALHLCVYKRTRSQVPGVPSWTTSRTYSTPRSCLADRAPAARGVAP